MTAIHDGRCAASTSRKFLLDVSDRRVKKKGECGGSFSRDRRIVYYDFLYSEQEEI